jgi:ABC-type branched-subunit amino acid transport system substrate-binding protein
MRISRLLCTASALSAVMLTVTLSACSSATSTAGATSVNTVPIAVLSSQSGSLAAVGVPYIQGAQYAVSEINKTGFKVDGKTYKFALSIENDNSDTATAVQKATGLISQNIVAMFGPLSLLAPPVAQLADKANVIFFDPSSGVAATAGPPSHPNVFVTNGDAKSVGITMFKTIETFVPKATSVAYLAPNEGPVQTDLPLLQAAAEKAGLKFFNDIYPFGTTVLSSVLTTMAAQKPSVVIMLDSPSDYQVQAPQFAGAKVPKSTVMLQFGSTAADCELYGMKYGYNCIADPSAGIDLSSNTIPASAKTFIKNFAQFTHTNQSAVVTGGVFATWTYDYVFLLAKAMAKAGTVTNTAQIADAMRGKVVQNGLVGKLAFNAHDGATFPLAVTYVSTGGKETTKTVSPLG